jgi:hypothetical protein
MHTDRFLLLASDSRFFPRMLVPFLGRDNGALVYPPRQVAAAGEEEGGGPWRIKRA